jgi:hypothetical protein
MTSQFTGDQAGRNGPLTEPFNMTKYLRKEFGRDISQGMVVLVATDEMAVAPEALENLSP